jgi:hypothetical protein
MGRKLHEMVVRRLSYLPSEQLIREKSSHGSFLTSNDTHCQIGTSVVSPPHFHAF